MKPLYATTLLGLLLWGTVGACLGQPIKPHVNDGQALLTQCRLLLRTTEEYARTGRPSAFTADQAMDSAYCLGLVDGLLEANIFVTLPPPEGKGTGPLFCLPDSYSSASVAGAIVRWLEEHPAYQKWRGTNAAAFALQDTFPCPPTGALAPQEPAPPAPSPTRRR